MARDARELVSSCMWQARPHNRRALKLPAVSSKSSGRTQHKTRESSSTIRTRHTQTQRACLHCCLPCFTTGVNNDSLPLTCCSLTSSPTVLTLSLAMTSSPNLPPSCRSFDTGRGASRPATAAAAEQQGTASMTHDAPAGQDLSATAASTAQDNCRVFADTNQRESRVCSSDSCLAVLPPEPTT